MTEAKHTPGPWEVSHDVTETLTVVCTTPRGLKKAIARVGGYGGKSRGPNARMMAAAPELLEALKRTLKHIKWEAACADEVTPGCREDMAHAEAAIAKATGEQA